MSRWAEIATVIGPVLVAAGVLAGGTRWAVENAVEPPRAEVRDLRQDVGNLREDVHQDIGERREGNRRLDAPVTRLEEGRRVIVMRLERVESRLDGIEAQKVAAR